MNLAPEVYKLTAVILTINYLALFVPFLICFSILPFLCFCLPSFIRFLDRLDERDREERSAQINTLPSETFVDGMYDDQDRTCVICLGDYEEGETIRVLHGRHRYHAECVDQWLLLNSSCPTCRCAIFDIEGAPISGRVPNYGSTNNPMNSSSISVAGAAIETFAEGLV